MKKKAVYIITIVLSILYIIFGNWYVSKGIPHFNTGNMGAFVKAEVTDVIDRTLDSSSINSDYSSIGVNINFEAKILSGDEKGKFVNAVQSMDYNNPHNIRVIEEKDKVLLVKETTMPNEDSQWMFTEYLRSDSLILLGIVFMMVLIMFGRTKGINTIISLIFTCLAIFTVFIPAILGGQNIYLWAVGTAMFIVTMTLLIVNGASHQALAAGIGCVGGMLVSAGLIIIMDRILHLTGIIDEESYYLMLLNEDKPIDLQAIVFAAILIGSIGAIMDISVDIAAALKEVADKGNCLSKIQLFQSGLSIGRDIIGTMANTLILAYIGSSMALVLLLVAYNDSLLFLFNQEMIVVEILQALIGSFGILFAVPIASLACGILYSKKINGQLQEKSS